MAGARTRVILKSKEIFCFYAILKKKRPAILLPDVWWAIQVVINIKVGTCFFSSLSHLAKDAHTHMAFLRDIG